MTLYRFSANLGFLWTHLPFPDRIRAAHAAGFDALEFHDQAQSGDAAMLVDLVQQTGLPICALNTRMGQTAGCAALPGAEDQAKADVDTAIAMAARLGAGGVHVLAGRSGAQGDRAAYIRVLRHALAGSDTMILIEPICRAAMADYFLHDLSDAAAIVAEIDHPRLKILFDLFHIGMQHDDVAGQFAAHAAQVGHVQIASVPGRNEPGHADRLDLAALLAAIRGAGYGGAFGCEYTPVSTVEAGLGWRAPFRPAAA